MKFVVTVLPGPVAVALRCTGATYGVTNRLVRAVTVKVPTRGAVGAETVAAVAAAAEVAAGYSWLNCDSPFTIE